METPAPTYEYVPLISDGSTFRIVSILPGKPNERIECFFLEVPISSKPRYSAVSYTWGNNAIAGYVWVYGRSIAIGNNLKDALQRLRDPEKLCNFWIDALCINQEEEKGEKTTQIPLMRHIYTKSHLVTIYLGREKNGSDKVPSLLDRIDRAYDLCKEAGFKEPITRAVLPVDKFDLFGLPNQRDAIWEGYRLLLSRDWFTRIWVIQEATLAASAEVICGQWSTGWTRFLSTALKAISLGVAKITDEEKLVPSASIPRNPLRPNEQLIFFNSLKPGNSKFVPWKLIDLLHGARISLATKPEDYCYGLMGISIEMSDPNLKIDTSLPVQAVYRQFARYFVAQGDGVKVLYNASGHSLILPSWVPDWSYRQLSWPRIVPPPQRTPVTNPAVAAASSFTSLIRLHPSNPDILVVRALLFDEIDDLGKIHESVNTRTHKQSETPIERGTDNTREDSIITLIVDCITELHELLSKEHMPRYPNGEDHETVVWRTLMCNYAKNSTAEAPSIYFEYYRSFLWLAKADYEGRNIPQNSYLDSIRDDKIVQQDPNDVVARARVIIQQMRRLCSSKRRGRTTRGYVGQFCLDAQLGDCVCIPLGSAVPYLIRPSPNNTYKLIGECYVHGIMQGEAFDIPNNDLDDLHFI
jgi:hypothetical protein